MNRQLSVDEQNYILQNYTIMSPSQLSKKLGNIQPYQISYFLKKNGLQATRVCDNGTKFAKFSKSDVEFIKNNYSTMPYKEIADRLGFSERQIRGKINNMGLKKLRVFNDFYFRKIDSPLKAYFLGFIFADGQVINNALHRNYELGIELIKTDEYILQRLNEELGNVHKITYTKEEKRIICGVECTHHESAILRIYSKNIVNDLIKHGVVENKTKHHVHPYVEDSLFFDFLRGYIDGDGCFYKNKNSTCLHITCASEETLFWISEKLSDYDINTRVSKETDKKFRLNCTDGVSMRKLVSRLYYKKKYILFTKKIRKS